MGTVTALSVYKAARDARARVRTERSRFHPTLRWIAGDAWWVAHRRIGRGTSCGAEGMLILAPPKVPLCSRCYPGKGTASITSPPPVTGRP